MLNSDWLSDSTLEGDWLYFSHVKSAISEADWTYRFLHCTCENIAPLYTVKTVTELSGLIN